MLRCEAGPGGHALWSVIDWVEADADKTQLLYASGLI